MGLVIAEWNKADLSQFVSGGSPDFQTGGGAPALSVVAVPERGNVLRYTPNGGTTVRQLFMLSVASGFVHPTDDERRDIDFEIEFFTHTPGPGGYYGFGCLINDDTPTHGICLACTGAASTSALLQSGGTSTTGSTGPSTSRLAYYQVRAAKPVGEPPVCQCYVNGWNATGGEVVGDHRRTGTNRGSVSTDGMGTPDATWNDLACDRLGLYFHSSGGNPAPPAVDILNFKLIDPWG